MKRLAVRVPADDIGHAIGYFGIVPWLLYAICAIEVTYLALVLGGDPAHTPLGLAALVTVLGALLLIVIPAPTPLPRWRTVTILVVIVAVTAAITWQYTPPYAAPRYGSWELNPCDLLMFCLAIRGRILAAWIGQSAMLTTIGLWSVGATGSIAHGLSFSYTQPFPLLAVTVFAIGLRRTTDRIAAHRTAERERAQRDAEATAIDLGTEVDLRAVHLLAGTALEQIAAGEAPEPLSVRSIEAALRDLIRGRNLAAEPLVSTLRDVRRRGVEVVLLDDLGDEDLAEVDRVAATNWASAHLSHARHGSYVLRLRLAGGAPIVTLTADGEHRAEIVLDGGPDPDAPRRVGRIDRPVPAPER